MNPFLLENKSILLVGATSDIGRTTAIKCAMARANLVLTGRNSVALEDVIRQVLPYISDRKIQSVICDLTVEANIETLVDALPVMDGVAISAGTLETLPCKMQDSGNILRAMNVNFNYVVVLVATMLRKKKINKGASIVFISSIAGNLLAEKGNSLYGASKAALSAYAKTLAIELAGRRVRVNCVMPGMVRTKFLNNFALDEEDFAADEQKYPLGYGTPDDVAYGIVYLLSDAARWITGTSLLMDGGRTLQ